MSKSKKCIKHVFALYRYVYIKYPFLLSFVKRKIFYYETSSILPPFIFVRKCPLFQVHADSKDFGIIKGMKNYNLLTVTDTSYIFTDCKF